MQEIKTALHRSSPSSGTYPLSAKCSEDNHQNTNSGGLDTIENGLVIVLMVEELYEIVERVLPGFDYNTLYQNLRRGATRKTK